ncbi:hypothetical protein WAX86_05390 [Photobacterium damselae subsp. damselae]|uniref:hypothetical protein n=1 Tax=Photobacterium damselae TaxID=38293 RepID=UPI00311AEA8E
MKKRIWIPIVGLVLVSFTSIPRVTYYKVMKYVLEPSIWNESVVITGAKPKDIEIYGNVMIDKCGIYSQSRIYKYEAEDLGNSYRLELPVIKGKIDFCNTTSSYGLVGFSKVNSVSNIYSIWGINNERNPWGMPVNYTIPKRDDLLCSPTKINYRYKCVSENQLDIKGPFKVVQKEDIQSARNIILNVKL